MRTIKFRGKRIKGGDWIYGSLVKELYNYYIVELIDQTKEAYTHISVEKETVSQFTGLHDKNGKEIYEGDINQYGYVIKYCEEKALFAEYGTRNGIDYDILMSYPIDSKSQIIKGNLYQNPELLTD